MPKLLWVFGMHRSGTSLLMHCLEALGAMLPPNLLLAAVDNPDGFQESIELVSLNDALLNLFNSSWDGAWPLEFSPEQRPIGPLAQECKRTITQWLEGIDDENRYLALKDPRICRTFQLWRQALPKSWCNYGIAIVRHPFAVVQSIGYRDDMPAAKALLLWLRHNLEICRHGRVPECRWPLLNFERLLDNPGKELLLSINLLNMHTNSSMPKIRSPLPDLQNRLEMVPEELQQLALKFYLSLSNCSIVQEVPGNLLIEIDEAINQNSRWSYLLLALETSRRNQLGLALAAERKKQVKYPNETQIITSINQSTVAAGVQTPLLQLKSVYLQRGKNILLHDLNLNLCAGERLALIGANGSGKTSLLRILSGIYRCSSGSVRMNGSPLLPIIEPNLGFSDQLSGIQCCKQHYLLYHRMSKSWIEFLTEIKSFTELDTAMNDKIANWSQGMRLRLTFALTTARSPKGLALDEGLAAGDQWFHRKAKQRLDRFLDQSGTVVIASHDTDLLKRYCSRAVILAHGKLIFDGSLFRALQLYQAQLQTSSA